MKKTVALALSCGGARGLTQIGVIRELERRGYTIQSVVGCSIGSIVGAFYAMNELDALSRFMESISATDMAADLDFTSSGHGVIKATRCIDKLKEIAPDRPIESLPVKLTIVATNLSTGQEQVFTRGSVYQAIRASIAIPVVITSVRQRGETLVDGSIANPLPLDKIQGETGNISVAVNLYGTGTEQKLPALETAKASDRSPMQFFADTYRSVQAWKSNLVTSFFRDSTEVKGYMGTLRAIFDLMTQRMIAQTLRLYPTDIVVAIPMTYASIFDFSRANDLIRYGEQQARAAIDAYEAASRSSRPRWKHWWTKIFIKQP